MRSVKFSVPTVEIRSTVTASDFLAFFCRTWPCAVGYVLRHRQEHNFEEKHLPGIDYILTRHRDRKLVRNVTVHLTEIRHQTITPNDIPTHLRSNLTLSQHMLLLLIPHIQRIVLAIEETTVTQQVSHRPIKCQSRSWSQTSTKVNESHHGDNPLLKPTEIQIATKSLAGPTNREYRKFIYVKTMFLDTSYSFAAHPPKSSKVIQKVFLAIVIGGLF